MIRFSVPLLPELYFRGCVLILALSLFAIGATAAELLPPGYRPLGGRAHALVGAAVVPRPGERWELATVVIRDGRIEAAGPGLPVPAGVQIHDLAGCTIYAGFIDSYVAVDRPVETGPSREGGASGAAGEEFSTRRGFYGLPGSDSDPGRVGTGADWVGVTPEFAVVDALSIGSKTVEGLRGLGFTVANVAPSRGVVRGSGAAMQLGSGNPNDQVLAPRLWQHVGLAPSGGPAGGYPGTVLGVLAVIRQSLLDARFRKADLEHYRQHPDRARPEFNPAWDALVPAIGAQQRVVFDPGSVLLLHRSGRVAREFGLESAFVASGHEWRRPDLLGSLPGPLIVPLVFPELSKLADEADWEDVSLDDLRAWDWAAENAAVIRRAGVELALTSHGLKDRKAFRKNLERSIQRGLEERDALAGLTTVPARLCGLEASLGVVSPGRLANLTVVWGETYFKPANPVREVWIDGNRFAVDPAPKRPVKDAAVAEAGSKPGAPVPVGGAASQEAKAGAAEKKPATEAPRPGRVARAPLEGRGPLTTDASVVFRHARIWTCGTAGILEDGDLWVRDGKVVAVGRGLVVSGGTVREIDATGRTLTPGLIDAHSHAMILAVNEGTAPSTAMVRIEDVVNSESENIRLELAGGLTVANLLHGSANPIGGQSAVIKLRDGATPEGLLIEGAPPGIKFALGENVKRSSSENSERFPRSRMGVRTFMDNRFQAALRYRAAREEARRAGSAPVRQDLEMDAMVEILEGRRKIHCHSYRQDEILAFLRVMESYGVKVATLQHVLEGYKVADEIARHGAGASCFSDWWAYKFEVIDAIPYAGALMHERGVLVSFNSDSAELARRMNLEAAKAVRYGNVPEQEALKFVTLNPARQLGIGDRVGSLEPGKDADFVLWSGHPLHSRTVCLETWIDGKRYFDREGERTRVKALAEERRALLERARKGEPGGGGDVADGPAKPAFFERAIEVRRADHLEECVECEEGHSR